MRDTLKSLLGQPQATRVQQRRQRYNINLDSPHRRHHADMGMVEDKRRGTNISRILGVVVLLHVIIIGGVMVHSEFNKKADEPKAPAAVRPPTLKAPIVTAPKPVTPDETNSSVPVLPEMQLMGGDAPTISSNEPEVGHITQAPPAEEYAEDVPDAELDALVHNGAIVSTPAPANSTSGGNAFNAFNQHAQTEQSSSATTSPAPTRETASTETKPSEPATASVRHLIRSGETWGRIARRYKVTEAQLKSANPKAAKSILKAGEYLSIPASTSTSTTVASQESSSTKHTNTPSTSNKTTTTTRHLIRSGETWGRVARRYGISESQLKAANPKSTARGMLIAGEYLAIPAGAQASAVSSTTSGNNKPVPSNKGSYYSVVSGDTMHRIARRHNISYQKLLKLNNMSEAAAGKIRIGQRIRVSD